MAKIRRPQRSVRDVAVELESHGIHLGQRALVTAMVRMGFAVKSLSSRLDDNDVIIAVDNLVSGRKAVRARYRMIWSTDDKGEQFPWVEVFDESGPYARRFEPNLNQADAGRWSGLTPDTIETHIATADGGVGPSVIVKLHDGFVRARLLALGVTRKCWEAAETELTWRRIRNAFRAFDEIEAAAMTALTSPDPELRKAALDMLGRVAESVEKDKRSPHGLETRVRKKGPDRNLRALLVDLETYLNRMKAEDAASRRDLFSDAKWLHEQTEFVNGKLVGYTRPPLPRACTPTLITELKLKPGKLVARLIIKAADPRWSLQDLERDEPLVRRGGKTKKK